MIIFLYLYVYEKEQEKDKNNYSQIWFTWQLTNATFDYSQRFIYAKCLENIKLSNDYLLGLNWSKHDVYSVGGNDKWKTIRPISLNVYEGGQTIWESVKVMWRALFNP